LPKLTIVSRDGAELTVDAEPGRRVMEVIRDSGFAELLALCGGSCACATCHVYVDPAFASRVPPMSSDESDLLSASEHLTPQSRLSCQLHLDAGLDGLKVTIAPED
jgi:ferredoxin, 2Fe-2S